MKQKIINSSINVADGSVTTDLKKTIKHKIMIKKLTTGFALMASVLAFSQVGIHTQSPKATLDVVGSPADNTKLDGIIAPRLSGAQLRAKNYTTEQTGALVYVTVTDTAPSGQTVDVTAPGYYYFNGTQWVTVRSADMVNIYNANGTLTSERTVTQNGNSLTFKGQDQSTVLSPLGGINVYGVSGSKRASIMLSSLDSNGNGKSARLNIYQDTESAGQILVDNDATKLSIGTHYTSTPAPLLFVTSSGNNANGVMRMYISGEGSIGVNTSSPNVNTRFHVVNKAADITPVIIEGCPTYTDNNAAISAGLPVGALYRKGDGTLMVRY